MDLSCVSYLDDLRVDDNGVWVHKGKPRRKYCVEFDDDTNAVLDAKLVQDNYVHRPMAQMFLLL